MQDSKRKKINHLYLVFLMIILIIAILLSFRTGMSMYYLVNTNLNDKDTPGNGDVATWNFEVRIEYSS